MRVGCRRLIACTANHIKRVTKIIPQSVILTSLCYRMSLHDHDYFSNAANILSVKHNYQAIILNQQVDLWLCLSVMGYISLNHVPPCEYKCQILPKNAGNKNCVLEFFSFQMKGNDFTEQLGKRLNSIALNFLQVSFPTNFFL